MKFKEGDILTNGRIILLYINNDDNRIITNLYKDRLRDTVFFYKEDEVYDKIDSIEDFKYASDSDKLELMNSIKKLNILLSKDNKIHNKFEKGDILKIRDYPVYVLFEGCVNNDVEFGSYKLCSLNNNTSFHITSTPEIVSISDFENCTADEEDAFTKCIHENNIVLCDGEYTTFNSYDRIIVRNHEGETWYCSIFSHVDSMGRVVCIDGKSYCQYKKYNSYNKNFVGTDLI